VNKDDMEHKEEELSIFRVHIGLFRRLLKGFADRFRPGQPLPDIRHYLNSPDLLVQDSIKRCFGAFDMKLEGEVHTCLQMLLVSPVAPSPSQKLPPPLTRSSSFFGLA
jgi:hypothetical protein